VQARNRERKSTGLTSEVWGFPGWNFSDIQVIKRKGQRKMNGNNGNGVLLELCCWILGFRVFRLWMCSYQY
jgi:hypothetical protein